MKNIIRRFSWIILDIIFINVSLILSLILRFGEGWGTYFCVYRGLIIYLTGFFLLFAVVFRLYKRIWRYLSIGDLFLIAEVVTGGIFVTVLCLNWVKGIAFPRTVVALTWFFSLALVTGGGGSIGGELARQICRFGLKSLVLLDHSENGLFHINLELEGKWPGVEIKLVVADIRDREKVERLFGKYKPEVVFHASAHKHVPMMEYHPDEAVTNNIIGTKNVAELEEKYEAERFVMISTDKAINPTSVMGASKRVAEMLVKELGSREIGAEERMGESKGKTKFVAVRFGNVLESNGSVIPMFKQQIAEGGPVTVTDREVKRYFMTLPEASQLMIQAGALGRCVEVFVLDLAEELIRLSGFVPDEDIEIKIVGLRPGEKLFEELLTEEERSRVLGDSGHEKIFIAKVEEVDGEKLREDIKELEALAKEMDAEGIVRKLAGDGAQLPAQ